MPLPTLDPQGVGRLFLYLIVGTFVLMALPYALRAWHWVLQAFENPPELPVESKFVVLFVLGVPVALLIGMFINFARRISKGDKE